MTRRPARMPSQRQLRVGEELRHALAWAIERGDIHDHALADNPVTLTEVQVSPDLKNATVFFVPFGDADADAGGAALKRATPALRHQIAKRVKLRVVPRLAFQLDTSFDNAARIERLLASPEVARDLDRDDEGEHGDGQHGDDGDGA